MVSNRIEDLMLSAAAVVAVIMGLMVTAVLGVTLLATRFFV
jgi:hypothetical protein